MSKVLSLLKSAPSVEAKSVAYEARIREELYNEMILPLEQKIKTLDTQIEDELDFSLNTDLNKGINTISRPEIQARVKKAIQLKYQKGVASLELQLLYQGFEELFDDEEEEEPIAPKRIRRSARTKAEAPAGEKAENTGTPEY